MRLPIYVCYPPIVLKKSVLRPRAGGSGRVGTGVRALSCEDFFWSAADLCQFPEVLGDGCEVEFVMGTAGTTQAQSV
jgi:hypothetical protein